MITTKEKNLVKAGVRAARVITAISDRTFLLILDKYGLNPQHYVEDDQDRAEVEWIFEEAQGVQEQLTSIFAKAMAIVKREMPEVEAEANHLIWRVNDSKGNLERTRREIFPAYQLPQ